MGDKVIMKEWDNVEGLRVAKIPYMTPPEDPTISVIWLAT